MCRTYSTTWPKKPTRNKQFIHSKITQRPATGKVAGRCAYIPADRDYSLMP